MGYSTDFTGELKFTKELTASQLAKVKSFLGQDCRQHPEWGNTELTYIDLEFTVDFTGLIWDGSEKTYDLTEKVNLIIENVCKDFPDFGLKGELLAQGENFDDRWALSVENNIASERRIIITGKTITCPHCEEQFILEESEETNV